MMHSDNPLNRVDFPGGVKLNSEKRGGEQAEGLHTKCKIGEVSFT